MEVGCETIQHQSLLVALLGDGKEPDVTRHISVSEIQHASVEEAADEPVIAPAGTTQPGIHIGMNPTVSESLNPLRMWQDVLRNKPLNLFSPGRPQQLNETNRMRALRWQSNALVIEWYGGARNAEVISVDVNLGGRNGRAEIFRARPHVAYGLSDMRSGHRACLPQAPRIELGDRATQLELGKRTRGIRHKRERRRRQKAPSHRGHISIQLQTWRSLKH